MKTIRNYDELRPYGLNCLTGEACGLGMRLLFDVTDKGRELLKTFFGVCDLSLPSNWNSGANGSIMLPHEVARPLMVFALLKGGCVEVWEDWDTKELYGIENAEELAEYVSAVQEG